MLLIVYVWCVEKVLKACWIIVDVISRLCGCELCNVMKMVIFSLFVWTCHLRYYEALVVTSVMCIEKEWVLKRMYHFEGCIARRDGHYILRDLSPRDGYYYRGSCRAPRQMHGQICPPWSRTERQRVCITRSDMHHYTWHCIPLNCTYLPLVNLISCFTDLLNASCGTFDRWILSFLLRICNLLKCVIEDM